MSVVPGRLEALVGAVLAHGANPDAVGQLDATDLNGSEELGERAALGALQTSTRGGVLRGNEERNTRGRSVMKALQVLLLADILRIAR